MTVINLAVDSPSYGFGDHPPSTCWVTETNDMARSLSWTQNFKLVAESKPPSLLDSCGRLGHHAHSCQKLPSSPHF